MVDAGSSGTRCHIFMWNNSIKQPIVQPYPKWNEGIVIKSSIPLSMASIDQNAIGNIFHPMIDKISRSIPSHYLSDTKIYIYATAGLRILPKSQQTRIMQNTYQYLYHNSPFHVLKKNVRIMSGAEEAIYGWISVQHLLSINNNSVSLISKQSVGSIDMGGASIQVAYHTNSRTNVYRITMNNLKTTYTIHAISILGLGVNEAMKKITTIRENPCFPKGYRSEDGKIEGKGSFQKCQDLIIKSFNSHIKQKQRNDSMYVNNFYGMASFYYTNEFFQLQEDSSVSELNKSTDQFCSSTWDSLMDQYNNSRFLKNYCFFGSFQSAFLTHGFGFHFSKSKVIKSGNLNGAELSWAIGAMMKEIKAVTINPYFIPSYYPIIFMNLFFVLVLISTFINNKKISKRRMLSSNTSMSKLL